jgi:hypothetical protein
MKEGRLYTQKKGEMDHGENDVARLSKHLDGGRWMRRLSAGCLGHHSQSFFQKRVLAVMKKVADYAQIRFGKDTDMGRWQFYTAGVNDGAQQDAYSSAFTFSEVNLGNVTYKTSGNKVFGFTVTGKNDVSSGYGTAIDYVMLTKQ